MLQFEVAIGIVLDFNLYALPMSQKIGQNQLGNIVNSRLSVLIVPGNINLRRHVSFF